MKLNWFIAIAGVLYLFGAVTEFSAGNNIKAGVWICYAGANFLLMVL